MKKERKNEWLCAKPTTTTTTTNNQVFLLFFTCMIEKKKKGTQCEKVVQNNEN